MCYSKFEFQTEALLSYKYDSLAVQPPVNSWSSGALASSPVNLIICVIWISKHVGKQKEQNSSIPNPHESSF